MIHTKKMLLVILCCIIFAAIILVAHVASAGDSLRVSGEVTLVSIEKDGEQYSVEEVGAFKVTTYCKGSCCNGKWTGMPAKNGEPLQVGYTIAVDPDVIPLGTWLYLEGIGIRKACDTGSAIKGNKIDLLIDDCSSRTTYYDVRVWVMEEFEI